MLKTLLFLCNRVYRLNSWFIILVKIFNIFCVYYNKNWTNDTIKSPYQNGRYEYAIIGGSGTGNSIVSPIFVVVDTEKPEDFHKYYKP